MTNRSRTTRISCKPVLESSVLCFALWVILFITGLCMGLSLSRIHNHILSKYSLDNLMPTMDLSLHVIKLFRSAHCIRLKTGCGSCLHCVFIVVNLVAGWFLFLACSLKVRYTKIVLASLYAINLCMFFFFLYCMVDASISVQGIMGVGEWENVMGGTRLGNMVCWIKTPILVFLVSAVIGHCMTKFYHAWYKGRNSTFDK